MYAVNGTHFVERVDNWYKILQASFSDNRKNVPLDTHTKKRLFFIGKLHHCEIFFPRSYSDKLLLCCTNILFLMQQVEISS